MQAWHVPRSLRLALLIRLEPAGSRATNPQRHSGAPLMRSAMSQSSPSQIRALLREKRNALTANQQQQYSHKLCEKLSTLSQLNQAKRVALYLANDGEIDTHPLIHWCWQNRIKVALPVLHPFSQGQLLFIHYHPSSIMVKNCFAIKEPRLDVSQVIPIQTIDVLFTPLVGFDDHGHRIGMGGGYYDRTLAPLYRSSSRPLTIGLAHSCQHVSKLPVEKWDMPLHCVATPDKIWNWDLSCKSV